MVDNHDPVLEAKLQKMIDMGRPAVMTTKGGRYLGWFIEGYDREWVYIRRDFDGAKSKIPLHLVEDIVDKETYLLAQGR